MAGMTGADWVKLAAGIGGAGLTAYVANRNSNRQAQGDQADRELTEEQSLRNTALDESKLDPFRQQMAQNRALTSFDMLQQYGTRQHVTPPANIAAAGAGHVQPGWRPSSQLLSSADAIRASVARGQGAPTMTDPANYGRTSAVDTTVGQPGGTPTGPGAAAPMPNDPASYIPDQALLRNEGAGGVVSGMKQGAGYGSVAGPYGAGAGLVIGGIAGAFTENAKTAATDLTVDQAKQALMAVYQDSLGRAASPQEIDGALAGQGLKPGDTWVGKDNLISVIRQIQTSAEARARQQPARAA